MATEPAQPILDVLDEGLRGPLVRPESRGYEAARAVFNGMIDRRPGAIARCADVADVLTAVRVAREHDMLVAARGGGHNAAGLGVCDGGLVVDLSALRGVRVDPAGRTVQVDGGCTWGDVDTPRMPSGWRRRRASSRPPVWAG